MSLWKEDGSVNRLGWSPGLVDLSVAGSPSDASRKVMLDRLDILVSANVEATSMAEAANVSWFSSSTGSLERARLFSSWAHLRGEACLRLLEQLAGASTEGCLPFAGLGSGPELLAAPLCLPSPGLSAKLLLAAPAHAGSEDALRLAVPGACEQLELLAVEHTLDAAGRKGEARRTRGLSRLLALEQARPPTELSGGFCQLAPSQPSPSRGVNPGDPARLEPARLGRTDRARLLSVKALRWETSVSALLTLLSSPQE